MIIFEFPPLHVDLGRVPATVCLANSKGINGDDLAHFRLADRVYVLNGTKCKVLKNRIGHIEDFELSEGDAVALVLSAVVL